jgi:hypothetical protein
MVGNYSVEHYEPSHPKLANNPRPGGLHSGRVEDLPRPDAPSQLTEEALYSTLKTWFELDAQHSNKWRRNAREEFDFAACRQWNPADERELTDAGRVPITFNRTLAIIKSVAGIEINGRHEIAFLPREATNSMEAEFNELLSEGSRWMGDGCDAADEQSDAFQDCCICGMGWTEQRLDFELDAEGQYVEERVDALEMYWDYSARAKNLVDARRVWRVKKMTLSDARQLFPDAYDTELDAPWARLAGFSDPAKPVEDRRLREENLKFDFDPKTEVHIVQVQWWERETYWRVVDPLDGAPPRELSVQEYQKLARRYAMMGRELIALEMRRRVYKQAFLGASILGGVRPAPVADKFTFQCITGERDRNEGTWFGLVRLMKDPQMWANKWLSQSLHILNTTAKGGILAEEDAFADQREAEETYALPDAITWVRKEAIQKGKIIQKPGGGIATPYINLLQFAITSIRDVVGINLELLGMRDAAQPGILEAQRKQAAMTILATLFDSLRRFRKQVGRVRLYMMQNYLSDGRWIRVTGDDGHKFVQLLRDKTAGQYDIIVDDAPTSPNQKEKSWGIIQMMLPAIRDMLTPEIVLMLLEYSPLPAKLVESLKTMLKEPKPEQQEAQQLQQAALQAKIARDQAAAARDGATAQRTAAGIPMDAAKTGLTQAQTEGTRAQIVLDMAQAANAASEAMRNKAEAAYITEEGQRNQDPLGSYDLNTFGGLLGSEGDPSLDQIMGKPADRFQLNFPNSLPQLPTQGGGGMLPPLELGANGNSGMPGGLLNLPRELPAGAAPASLQ